MSAPVGITSEGEVFACCSSPRWLQPLQLAAEMAAVPNTDCPQKRSTRLRKRFNQKNDETTAEQGENNEASTSMGKYFIF